jgi:hypothetical protein
LQQLIEIKNGKKERKKEWKKETKKGVFYNAGNCKKDLLNLQRIRYQQNDNNGKF